MTSEKSPKGVNTALRASTMRKIYYEQLAESLGIPIQDPRLSSEVDVVEQKKKGKNKKTLEDK